MAARPRDAKNRPLPPNLYGPSKAGGSYMWRNPMTGKKASAGTDKKTAIRLAIQSNAELAQIMADREVSILKRMSGAALRTVGAWWEEYETIYAKRKRSEQTRSAVKARLATLKGLLGEHKLIEEITPLDVANILKGYTDAGKVGMAKNLRANLLDVFREAMQAGWCKGNPVAVTKVESEGTKRERLTLADALAIRSHMSGWALNAFDLALLTAQRREDVAAMTWPKDGFLLVTQSKTTQSATPVMLRIPVSLYLPALKLTLGDVVARCRDAVVSQHLVHHARRVARVEPGDRLSADSLSDAFAEARAAAKVGGKFPPTFHELRSLSVRLWTEQKGEAFAKSLSGHKTEAMFAVYRDSRGAEWVTISA